MKREYTAEDCSTTTRKAMYMAALDDVMNQVDAISGHDVTITLRKITPRVDKQEVGTIRQAPYVEATASVRIRLVGRSDRK